jgi:small redox-active disulfide protein 2
MRKIKVLGPGCPRCKQMEVQTRLAVSELGLECEIEKVEDIQKIMAYGILMTPALVVDGAVKVSGRVPSVKQIKDLLS